ncbi:hypothetical protein AOQ84DRAFT_227513 [Glonium stellatum]|uniref:Uncharacterized protein n=1 Tax=Glonium stellatum TaxID=574774 RepID=A0A8E2JN00_9PEZI|nr:hypothetical protein AOQ84DRAFT_227513 [Glonium stellatum]
MASLASVFASPIATTIVVCQHVPRTNSVLIIFWQREEKTRRLHSVRDARSSLSSQFPSRSPEWPVAFFALSRGCGCTGVTSPAAFHRAATALSIRLPPWPPRFLPALPLELRYLATSTAAPPPSTPYGLRQHDQAVL